MSNKIMPLREVFSRFSFRHKVWVLVAIIAAVIFVPVFSARSNKLELNQFLIQKLKVRYFTASSLDLFNYATSAYLSGVDILTREHLDEPSFDSPREMFDYVFSWVPPRAIVYPTEGFYYWNFIDKQGRPISGNFRLADLDDGLVHFTYFVVHEDGFKTISLSEKDGVTVKQTGDNTYEVSNRTANKTVKFIMPRKDYNFSFQTIPGEKPVGVVFDESGISLNLIYSTTTKNFYEFLREEDGVNDTLLPLFGRYLIGQRTGFVFYQDDEYNRKILVGVDYNNNAENNYLDGPGDQVPFWLNLRPLLNEAYPSTLLGEGVNDYGVLLGTKDWQRFVIAPFYLYQSSAELKDRSQKCDQILNKSRLWDCLTREWWNTPQWREDALKKVEAEKR